MLPSITVFSWSIPTYYICGLAGAGAAAALAALRNRAFRLPRADVLFLSLYGMVGALIGSKLLFLITILPELIEALPRLLESGGLLDVLVRSGMVFYGGLFGSILGAQIYARRYKVPFRTYADLLAPCVALFHAFGRVGCFLTGCCWGIEVPWGLCYTHAAAAPNGVPLLPIQLIESFLLLALCAVLVFAFKNAPRDGRTFRAYLLIYAVMRFTLEFFRGDELRGIWLGLSTSQWISLAVLAVLLIGALRRRFRKRLKAEDASATII